MGEKPPATDKDERRRLKAEKKARHRRLKAEKKARKEAKKEERKKRKRDEKDGINDDVDAAAASKEHKHESSKKSKKKDKTKDKKLSKEDRKTEREMKKAAKKAEKASLLEQVPKTDEHGIAYTKIQIRRMARRVKRGLPPVPTEEEERERLRQDKLMREEEEQELADMLYKKEEESDKEDADQDGGDDESDESDESDDDGQRSHDVEEDNEGDAEEESKSAPPPQPPAKKKAKRSKAVPSDYVCQACQNKNQPAHWIYDCPDKKTVRGTNQVAKKLRGINQPDSRKVFVSGLPFEIKSKDVEKYFQESCGKVVHCKLLTFEDTKRCKGQAFLTFETDEAAKKAIKKSGEVLDYEPEQKPGKKKKKGDDGGVKKKKDLVLKVQKLKSRVATQGRKF